MSIKMDLKNNIITAENYAGFLEYLMSLRDEKYREFHSSLVPNEEKDSFLGVRMPKLRELGRELSKGDPRSFLSVCGSVYYEEKMLRAIVTGLIKPKDYAEFLSLADDYIPYISNWALCDCFVSGLKYVKKCRAPFFEHIKSAYLSGGDPWAVRAGLVLMLNYYLDDGYIGEVLSLTDAISLDHYYVKMAQAWLIATAVAKCEARTLEYMKSSALPKDVYNKAIQKSIESYRVSDETKAYLRSIKKH